MERTGMEIIALYICMYISWAQAVVCGDCRFPDQMYGTDRDWRIMSRDPDVQQEHAFRAVVFEDSNIRVDYYRTHEYMDGISTSHTYQCVVPYREDMYIVKKIQYDRNAVYTCIQFIIHNTNVVQWKLGPDSEEKDSSLCHSDGMVLQDAPLVYYHVNGFWNEQRNIDAEPTQCPLVGGFIAHWYDSSQQSTLCRENLPPMKVESECEPGEGFRFVFPYGEETPDCAYPSDSEGPLGDEYSCLAHWQSGIYTFMVLAHAENDFFIPCVRFPTAHAGTFELLFFKDGVCSPYIDVTQHSTSYMSMTLSTFVVEDECQDLTPECYVQAQCDSVDINHIAACRDTCDLCVEGTLQRRDFKEAFHGEWIKSIPSSVSETWAIEGASLSVGATYRYANLGESDCTADTPERVTPGLGSRAVEYNMISFYDNGCSPRVTSLSLVNRSEAVLSYRLSQSTMAPIQVDWRSRTPILDNSTGSWCQSTSYDYDPAPAAGNFHKTSAGWHNLVREGGKAVPCHLPFETETSALEVQMNLGLSGTCSGKLVKTSASSFQMNINSCRQLTEDVDTQSANLYFQNFKCIGSFIEPDSGKQFVFTESPTPIEVLSSPYVCWVIEGDRLSWYHSGVCDSLSTSPTSYQQEPAEGYVSVTMHLAQNNANANTISHICVLTLIVFKLLTH